MAFRHLIVPTDFSEPANHALRYALAPCPVLTVRRTGDA